ncbi:MAG: hypothetical protein JKX73_00840 [Flavobacteriales bacterium]|nr:hypothetical protein [Flavobacteriales bacterium]
MGIFIFLENSLELIELSYYWIGLPITIAYLWSTILLCSIFVRLENSRSISNNGLITWALIYVLPIGIFWIQPRVEKILETRHNKKQTALKRY